MRSLKANPLVARRRYNRYSVDSTRASNVWSKLPRCWAVFLYHRRPSLFFVAWLLYTHDGPRGCFPSVETLAEESGLFKTNVYTALRELKAIRFYIPRRVGKRTYFDLQKFPSPTTKTTTINTEISNKVHHLVGDEIYHEKVINLMSQGDRIYQRSNVGTDQLTDQGKEGGVTTTLFQPRVSMSLLPDVCSLPIFDPHFLPSPHPYFAAPLPAVAKDCTVAKIVGPIRRERDDAQPVQAKAPRKLSEQAQTLLDIANWFSQKCFARIDLSKPAMQKWASIYNRYEQKCEIVKQVCLEAYECRDTLLSDEWPVWGVQSVWFYMSYKRKETVPTDHARIIKLHEQGRELKALRTYIKLHGVSRETVRGIVQAKFYDELFAEMVRES